MNDELAVLRLAAGAQMKRKVVKVGVQWAQRGATFEIEEYLEKPGAFDGHVWRAVSIIEETSKGFFDEIRAIVPSPANGSSTTCRANSASRVMGDESDADDVYVNRY